MPLRPLGPSSRLPALLAEQADLLIRCRLDIQPASQGLNIILGFTAADLKGVKEDGSLTQLMKPIAQAILSVLPVNYKVHEDLGDIIPSES